MTDQQLADSHSPAVTKLPYTGNPEQDHLIDEIQHPESTEALYAMPGRPAPSPVVP
jgi:hypothetical protein